MSKIVILGNSSIVLDRIKSIRDTDSESSITLLCTENVLPYSRSLLPRWLSKNIKEAQLFPQHDKFFTDYHVEIISNDKLSRVSVKRRHVTLESKKQISYDHLIISDTGLYKMPQGKGFHKKGVFDILNLTSVKNLNKWLINIDTVFISVTNFQGLNIACALAKLEKEVIILVTQGLLSSVFDDETSSLLRQILEAKGIRILEGEIEEILGDTEVKAVRLKTEKVMAAGAVVFDESSIDLGILSDSQLTTGDDFIIEDIFQPLMLPIPSTYFGLDLLNGFAQGVTSLPEGGREYLRFNGPQNIFKKIYVVDDRMVGAVLYNAPELINPFSQMILNQESIIGREESLLGN